MPKKRIVLTTFGSLGDLHPYLGIACELKARGHEPIIATLDIYREKVEGCGIGFRLLRSSLVAEPNAEIIKQVLDRRHGIEFIVRTLLMPALRVAYEDTLEATQGVNLIVSHPLTLASRVAAEVQKIPWVSTQLSPLGFLSPHDPPVLPAAPYLRRFRRFGVGLFGPVMAFAKHSVRHWTEPYRVLRQQLGLPPCPDPFFASSYAPSLVLALFSELLGAKQKDWPKQTVITGFPFFDSDRRAELDPRLARFLDAGSPPIVFTLGTSAVMAPGRFYQDSIEAAQMLGMRAILLVGNYFAQLPNQLPHNVMAFDYAPFSQLLPRTAVVVHQGGVGTTGQAMRSGCPMLVIPYALDQPDNAARVERLGIARVITRAAYSAQRAAEELNRLLTAERYEIRARTVGDRIMQEDGAVTASAHLESILA